MLTIDHENYIRFILLLLQAGTDLLREIIQKALKSRGETLHQFLHSFHHAISNDRKLTRIQKDTLYPSNAQCASIEDFDITLLSHLINNYLNKDINQLEMDVTNEIQQWRNKYHAHTTEAKMDAITYNKEWTKLVRNIIKVDTGMSSEVGKRHVYMIDHIGDDSIDIMALVQEIKKLDMSRAFYERIQDFLESVQTDLLDIKATVQNTAGAIAGVDRNLSNTKAVVTDIKAEVTDTKAEVLDTKAEVLDTKNDIMAKVMDTEVEIMDTKAEVMETKTEVMDTKAEVMDTKALVLDKMDMVMAEVKETKSVVMQLKDMIVHLKQQMENQGIKTQIDETMYGKVYLGADDQETVDQAEADLLEASTNSVAKKEPTDTRHQVIQEKVDLVVKDIENLDVKVEGVRKGSIIFEFKCQSLTAILDLIDYFYSSNFQRRLDVIAQALEDVTGKKVYITAVGIDRQTLKNVIYNLQKKEYEKVVKFEMSCASVDGLLHILEVFEEGKAANSLNELSKALSESMGKPVSLHTSIDIDQMKKAIQKIKDQLAAEDPQKSSARLIESKDAGSPTEATELTVNPHHKPAETETSNLQNASLLEKRAFNTIKQEQKCEHLPSVNKNTSKQKFEDVMADVLPNQSLSATLGQPNYIIIWDDQVTEPKMEYAGALHKEHPSDLPESTSTAHNDMPSVYQNEQQNNITKCAYLSPHRLLVANQNNKEVVVVDIKTGSVVNKKKLHGTPFDIAVLPEDQAAVTLQYGDKVLIISTADMSTLNKISFSGDTSGITYHKGELYVVYQPSFIECLSVRVLNLKDGHHREVKLDILNSCIFEYLDCYIAVSKIQQSLYITDWKNSAVIRYSLKGKQSFQGKRTAEYQHEELKQPEGLTMLDDGSLLVCCRKGTIHHISSDLKQGYILTRVPSGASSIAYDPDKELIYIISMYSNIIHVFSLTNTITSKVKDPIQYDAQLESASFHDKMDTNFYLKVQPETDSAKVLGEMDYYNKLEVQSFPSSSQQKTFNVVSIVYKKTMTLINIDNPGCLAVLSPTRILVSDISNYTLIVVNIHTETVLAERVLHECPFDIAVLPKEQAALTFPLDKKIMFLSTTDMSTIGSIPVNGYPSGITYHQDELYVVNLPSSFGFLSVLVLNSKGDHLREVISDIKRHDIADLSGYIAVSKSAQSLYITDVKNNAVIRYSLQGKRTAEYQLQQHENPDRLIILDDGSLLVFCLKGPIHHISADLQIRWIVTRFAEASFIAYDPDKHLVYISSNIRNTIHVFTCILKNIVSDVVTLVFKKDINLENICLPGCIAVLSPKRILIADNTNNTISAVNIPAGSVVNVVVQRVLHEKPFDVAVLTKDQVAVTFPRDDMIMILSTSDMSTIWNIPVRRYPSGITYHQDELYVVYLPVQSSFGFLSVLVLNLKEGHKRNIALDTYMEPVYHFCNIAVSKPQHSLFITDWTNNAVIRYSLQGKRTAEYQHEELVCPEGLTMLDDGSLLVCCLKGTIHHISADLKQDYILAREALGASSIAYDPDNQLIFINSGNRNIKMYNAEKTPT